MTECLIITPIAHEFVEEVERLTDGKIPVRGCRDEAELEELYQGHRVLFGNPSIIASTLDRMPDVEWIQSSWAGVTPLIEHKRRDYILTGVKDVFGPQMSEYVFGYLLAHELKIFERKRRQDCQEWYKYHSGMLEGRSIGIMGTGSIGRHIAETARAFGLSVRGLSRTGAKADHFDAVYDIEHIQSFLEGCHYLVSTLPKTPDTDGLLSAQTLGKLPTNAYFINVGRSNVIDDEALVRALESGRLSGAVLDVFDEEPIPADDPLWNAPNLLITAHISAISHPLLLVPIFVENYERFVQGKPLRHVVNFDAGY
ncbi:MAG: D-2-hydroxyacid dehydrogenase [Pseudomonadota bacterium]|nr:D-2-hydroxyacid dehydrogenase [Pseudomonadota bacterium]